MRRPCTLRPFFSLYGGKWRVAALYPQPRHRTVVEPFAGGAGYAVRHAHLDVVLCDLDPVLAGVWKYLVRVSAAELLALPDLQDGESVDDLAVPQEARWLIGFWLNRGVARPRKRPSAWMRSGVRPGSFWGERVRQTLVAQVEQIRHWRVYECSYEQCPVAGEATWFIDPPYVDAGSHYRFGSGAIDYERLSRWCRARSGQIVVCENEGADWLPFQPLADIKTTRAGRRSREAVWMNRRAA